MVVIFMSRVNLECDCCEESNVNFNNSAVSLNTGFKHIVLQVGDVEVVSHRISDAKKYDQGAKV